MTGLDLAEVDILESTYLSLTFKDQSDERPRQEVVDPVHSLNRNSASAEAGAGVTLVRLGVLLGWTSRYCQRGHSQ